MSNEIKNLKKAAQRILSQVKKKERIILFADSDLDGVTSLIILQESIKNLGWETPFLYFSDREREGYGLTEKSLNFLKKYAPALLILLDCGIGSFKEIKKAKENGLETIIIEHHEVLDKLPKAKIIVNPKQKGDEYPFKFLATCGLSFKLAKTLLKKKISKNLEQSFLELVALGTMADMMPQIEDNKFLIEKGLETLPFTFRPGLKIFFKDPRFQNFSLKETAQKIISILQITDLKNHLTESYLLLTSRSQKEAKKLIEVMWQKNSHRQETLKVFFEEIAQKVAKNFSPIIFEGGTDFPYSLSGSLASRILQKFKKPTFIFNSNKNLSRGSARTPQGVNSVEALKHCSQLLEEGYGGHPQASGFACKTENLKKLKECLEKYFSQAPPLYKPYGKNNCLH
ncbi:MAG: DHH family phosphoesterase [Patescibacteria group bacterium]|nr:DHH family phosphoesterase [Patescibacteria group bacterium]